MTTVTYAVASFVFKAAVNAKRMIQRSVHALMEAKMRRIQHETEFHRRLNDHRRAMGLSPLSREDFRRW